MWYAVPMTRPDPVSLRLPEPLKSSIQQAANQAGRSLNAEIRMRLEWSFEAGFDGDPSDKMLSNEVESLRGELRGAVTNVKEAIRRLEDKVSALERGA
jgi:hypothetical protein